MLLACGMDTHTGIICWVQSELGEYVRWFFSATLLVWIWFSCPDFSKPTLLECFAYNWLIHACHVIFYGGDAGYLCFVSAECTLMHSLNACCLLCGFRNKTFGLMLIEKRHFLVGSQKSQHQIDALSVCMKTEWKLSLRIRSSSTQMPMYACSHYVSHVDYVLLYKIEKDTRSVYKFAPIHWERLLMYQIHQLQQSVQNYCGAANSHTHNKWNVMGSTRLYFEPDFSCRCSGGSSREWRDIRLFGIALVSFD